MLAFNVQICVFHFEYSERSVNCYGSMGRKVQEENKVAPGLKGNGKIRINCGGGLASRVAQEE